MKREFEFVVEKDEDGWFVGYVPELPGCHTQAKTRAQLRKRMKEAVELYLLDAEKLPTGLRLIGLDSVQVET